MAEPQASAWTVAGTVGGWAAFITLLTVLVRQWVPLRQIRVSADEKLRDELARRVEALEKKLEEERSAAESARVTYEANTAVLRHQLNNVTACFDALLLLIEANPDKAGEAVTKIKEMRRAQLVAEASEKGALHRDRIDRAGSIME